MKLSQTHNGDVVFEGDKSSISSVALLIPLIILMSLNTYNGDYPMYLRMYASSASWAPKLGEREVLFTALCKLGNVIGLNYVGFASVYLTTGLLLVYRFIVKHSKQPFIILALYTFTGYILDAVEIRQFMAMAILLNFISYLNKRSKSSGFIFVFGIIIASMIHKSYLVYIALLLVKLNDRWRKPIIIGITLLVLTGAYAIIESGIYVKIAPYIMEERQIEAYIFGMHFGFRNSITKVFTNILSIQLAPLIILVLMAVLNRENRLSTDENGYVDIVLLMHIILLSITPLFFFSLQFERLLRITLIPTFIAYEKLMPKLQNARIVVITIIALWIMVYFILTLRANNDIWANLFSYNVLLGT